MSGYMVPNAAFWDDVKLNLGQLPKDIISAKGKSKEKILEQNQQSTAWKYSQEKQLEAKWKKMG